ncbi:hypothetical protein CPB85DRAFT_1312581 [Mucidula mucida]|nr:hypothetical protein CPB85DRAFT_1312581 [Mucidula mucida]
MPSSPPTSPSTSTKIPKFLQRDRSKSVNTPSSSDIEGGAPRRKSGRLFKDKHPPVPPLAESSSSTSSPPIPIPTARPRQSSPPSSRPLSDSSTSGLSPGVTSRIGGWIAHTFSGSTQDLSLPALLATSPRKSLNSSTSSAASSSSRRNAILTAAKTGKGHLDKAVRYLLDSDSTPDRCTDMIWLLGVEHKGWDPTSPTLPPPPPSAYPGRKSEFRSSTSSLDSIPHDPSAQWPPDFYLDFVSRVWLTYRSQFAPIRDGRLADLQSPCTLSLSSPRPGASPSSPAPSSEVRFSRASNDSDSTTSSPTSTLKKWSNWGRGERGWTSDSGWGCMLRTGQSLLANALVNVHLGRGAFPTNTHYATYIQLLTWFLDTPDPHAPFSVHRLALAGKELGTDVGQWFGPNRCVRSFNDGGDGCGMAIYVAGDSGLVASEVRACSHPTRHKSKDWGSRPVYVLLEFGLELTGGRPSSSYYFAPGLTQLQTHYVSAYAPSELRTFHCERVRKMPLSGLDPSMLIGFLVRDEADFVDLRARITALPMTIFTVVDEAPRWGGNGGWDDEDEEDDEMMGMESIDDDSFQEEELVERSMLREEEVGGRSSRDTDPEEPITPLPGGRFDVPVVEALDDIEDDEDGGWDDLSPPARHHTPSSSQSSASIPPPPIPPVPKVKKTKSKKTKEKPVPVPMVKFPGESPWDTSSTSEDGGTNTFVAERQRRQSIKLPVRRGKDGGRTTSGGVRGVLVDEVA